MSKKRLNFKIIVIGDGGVGKTSLIKQFTQGAFENDYVKTIGAQFSKFSKDINGDKIKLIFWDIAGQDDFLFLRPSFYKDSNGAIIIYSLEENNLGKRSFKNLKKWYEDILKFCRVIPTVLLANKADLIEEHNLNKQEIKEVVDRKSFLGYHITSAKTGQGVIDAFDELIEFLYLEYQSNLPPTIEK
ncbi:hypothetical protein LCGC14_1296330 [marine sediment metagenome]|uniref:Roc domain-containing protein n=1 Tax=marine sediment metagenome TaxID=412755 RepID=A0A0F9KSP5_9ZZZZ